MSWNVEWPSHIRVAAQVFAVDPKFAAPEDVERFLEHQAPALREKVRAATVANLADENRLTEIAHWSKVLGEHIRKLTELLPNLRLRPNDQTVTTAASYHVGLLWAANQALDSGWLTA